MMGLNIHENIPVSVAKVTLDLRVGFISSELKADELCPVNHSAIKGPPKMSLLLEAKTMPALIIKPRLIIVTHTDDLGRYITSTQQDRYLFKTQQDCQQGKCCARADPVLHH